MGGKESKQFPISYEEASKRVTDNEKRRLQDAFRRSSAANNNISKQAFLHDVLGESVPVSLAEQVFNLVGGGRGVSFRELLTLLVLLTRGTREEKVKFIYGVLAVDSGTHIERADMARACIEWDGGPLPSALPLLFQDASSQKATFEQFAAWLDVHHDQLALASWILSPNSALSLVSTLDTPTFYQTLAGVTHLSEQEVMELEKRFWSLVGNSASGRIDLGIITPLVSPPLPSNLVLGLFKALDENRDGHVDFKELACGVSAACRGPEMERQKFCFKIFDEDNDGVLSKVEVRRMVEAMKEVASQGGKELVKGEVGNESNLAEKLLGTSPHLSLEDFLVWTVENALAKDFAKLIFQLCHVVLGLRPSSRREEGELVRGWLAREEAAGLAPGQVWYLLPMAWWTGWHAYVNWTDTPCSGSLSRKKKAAAVSSSLASDASSRVVATGYSPLSEGSRPSTPGSTRSSTSSTPPGKSSPSPFIKSSPSTPSVDSMTRSTPSSPATPRRQAPHPSRPGPIDTSCLIQTSPHRGVTVLTGEGGKLRGGSRLARGRDYELVPERLWKFLSGVYGGTPALPRQVIRNSQGQVELELNPLNARIMKHQTVQRQPNVPTMVGGYSAAALQTGVVGHGGYSVPGAGGPPSVTRRYHAYQAAFSKRTAIGQISEFICGRLHVKQEDLRLWLYRGDEATMRMLDVESVSLEEVGFQDEDSILAEMRSRDGTWPEEISSLSTGRGVSREQPAVPGVTGLNNLGNTCYMNAALQVVSSTRILANYFKLNCHLFELNRSNPLGMKGHIAKRYGDLVRDMWSGETRTIAPIKLRWTIGKYQAAFSSFQQQDSQELLAFLLDGLHEDLNRVTDKPYVELKDSEGRPDLAVAAEAWENHSLRNRSIIVDLFHGQLKSKVTCKVCGHESVRCDPFFTLSLPLPMERCISLEVVVMLQDGSTPRKYGLSLDMEDKCSAIPPALAKHCSLPPSNIILVDIVQSQVRAISGNEQKVRGLGGSCIYAYEVTRSAERVTNTAERKEGEESLTITDIQRSVHSKLKGSSSGGSTPGGAVENVEGEGESGGKMEKGEPVASPNATTAPSTLATLSTATSSSPSGGRAPSPSTLDTGALLPPAEEGPELRQRRSRASSASSTLTAGTLDSERCSSSSLPPDIGDATQGVLVCLHRKMIPQEFYFLSSEKYSPSLFGIPLVVSCTSTTTCTQLYKMVWEQVARLVSPLPPQDQAQSNHATDCDDSMGYEYPFVLKAVTSGGSWCAWCPWHRMCRGCELPASSAPVSTTASFYAIDWDPTALHLRYLAAAERAWIEDPSVVASRRAATEPITLAKCLEAFTQEEELGEDEKYYCSACKSHQLAIKKLQIWRLPPILIIHLKRFQCVNNRWIKSHKIVDFPLTGLDPTSYLAAVPAATLNRHKELLAQGRDSRPIRSSLLAAAASVPPAIAESSEPASLTSTYEPPSLEPLALSGSIEVAKPHARCVRQPSTGSGLDVAEVVVCVEEEDPNDSGIESSGGNGGGHPTLEREKGLLERGSSTNSEVFDSEKKVEERGDSAGSRSGMRQRQISTSLVSHPVLDDNLLDFHGHKLQEGVDPLTVQYSMYAMVCHSGVLGGGHYVSYSKTESKKWFCHNDSSCKEVPEGSIDKSSAYILMYEREGLSMEDYMPDTSNLSKDTGDLDEEFDLDFKKQCSLM